MSKNIFFFHKNNSWRNLVTSNKDPTLLILSISTHRRCLTNKRDVIIETDDAFVVTKGTKFILCETVIQLNIFSVYR